MEENFEKRIIIGLTACNGDGWQEKLKEINKLKIKKITLFVEEIEKSERKKLYNALLNSVVKEIPLVHIRHDSTKDELIFLEKNFKSKYFTIHETGFKILKNWNGFYKKLYLEFNYNNFIPKNVKIEKIGGFCIDLSHFKVSEKKLSKEFEYVMKRKNLGLFKCNHLNGYSYERNCDVHYVKTLKELKFLKTLPKFLFGDVIALEMYNSIQEQLNYKKNIIKILNQNQLKIV